MEMTAILPEECIAHIMAFTSPRDACRSSVVSPVFRAAVDSDTVWERFLPSDYLEIISESTPTSSSSSVLASLSKKDLYFHLCKNPILLNNSTKSFSIDKESGKKCYMVGGRGLNIAWGDTPHYWKWKSLPESRFPEVPELKLVWWLDVNGKMDVKLLSPKMTYVAYFVFKLTKSSKGSFRRRPVELSVHFDSEEGDEKRRVFLDPRANTVPVHNRREDGWMEIEMGEFFNECGDDGTIVCKMFDFDGSSTKTGLVVEGIERRPKTKVD